MKLSRGLRVLLLAVLVCMPLAAGHAEGQEEVRRSVKRLYAAPEEVAAGLVALPAPERTPTVSRVSFIRADFHEAGNAAVAEVGFAHAGGPARVFLLGPGALFWQTSLRLGDVFVDLDGEALGPGKVWKSVSGEVSQGVFGLNEPARFHELELDAGSVAIRLTAPRTHVGRSAVALVDDGGTETLTAHLASRINREGDPCELVVRGGDGALAGLPSARPTIVDRASIRWPDGVTENGLIEAGPGGAITVRFLRSREGDAVAWIDGRVADRAGVLRARTVHYPIRISRAAGFSGVPTLHVASGGGAWIEAVLPVEGLDTGEVAFVAAELWIRGDSRATDARCVGWIGGLAEVEGASGSAAGGASGGAVVRLGFDPDCARLAGSEWLELRALRLHDRDGFAPMDFVDSARPLLTPEASRSLSRAALAPERPRVAWHGPAGIAEVAAPRANGHMNGHMNGFMPGVGSHVLALAHGYCADANTWPPSHFGADAYYYLNPNQNLSNDAFALDLADRCDQYKSYGVVAHSQGGCAALHLYAFYWSGLDWAGPGRLVQSLGTPFEGTALAGNVAALGEIFGVQCGSTFDMTYDGAAAWLSTIPAAARARVYTHTTTFQNVPFFYDYCNLLSDLLLNDPEDGVVEHASGHIVGANDMGLRSGWCHVAGMRDPDQTLDASRNGVMNAQGAR